MCASISGQFDIILMLAGCCFGCGIYFGGLLPYGTLKWRSIGGEDFASHPLTDRFAS
jgi:hypothetical protein